MAPSQHRGLCISDVSIVIEYLRILPEIYKTADKKQKGRILNEIAQRINVNPHGIEIVWNEEYQPLLNQDIMLIHPPQFGNIPLWVADGIRTRNKWIHSPWLYR
jgi:hypothetical protein